MKNSIILTNISLGSLNIPLLNKKVRLCRFENLEVKESDINADVQKLIDEGKLLAENTSINENTTSEEITSEETKKKTTKKNNSKEE